MLDRFQHDFCSSHLFLLFNIFWWGELSTFGILQICRMSSAFKKNKVSDEELSGKKRERGIEITFRAYPCLLVLGKWITVYSCQWSKGEENYFCVICCHTLRIKVHGALDWAMLPTGTWPWALHSTSKTLPVLSVWRRQLPGPHSQGTL